MTLTREAVATTEAAMGHLDAAFAAMTPELKEQVFEVLAALQKVRAGGDLVPNRP